MEPFSSIFVYAGDVLIFGKHEMDGIYVINNILNLYCQASGQKSNCHKSTLIHHNDLRHKFVWIIFRTFKNPYISSFPTYLRFKPFLCSGKVWQHTSWVESQTSQQNGATYGRRLSAFNPSSLLYVCNSIPTTDYKVRVCLIVYLGTTL